MYTLLTLAAAAALSGCAVIVVPNDDVHARSTYNRDAVAGDGKAASERRAVGKLPGLDVAGPLHVEVRVGGAPSLQVDADSNLLPMIRTEAAGGKLRMWIDGYVRSTNPVRVTYTVPSLDHVQASGSGRLVVSGLDGATLRVSKSGSGSAQLEGRVTNLDLHASGAGSIDAGALRSASITLNLSGTGRVDLGQLDADTLRASVSGSGEVQASGAVRDVRAQVDGSGVANLAGLNSDSAELATNGSGAISVKVRKAVVAHAKGSGWITVYGNPAQRKVSGKNVNLVQ